MSETPKTEDTGVNTPAAMQGDPAPASEPTVAEMKSKVDVMQSIMNNKTAEAKAQADEIATLKAQLAEKAQANKPVEQVTEKADNANQLSADERKQIEDSYNAKLAEKDALLAANEAEKAKNALSKELRKTATKELAVHDEAFDYLMERAEKMFKHENGYTMAKDTANASLTMKEWLEAELKQHSYLRKTEATSDSDQIGEASKDFTNGATPQVSRETKYVQAKDLATGNFVAA